jgi:hypothetical protein
MTLLVQRQEGSEILFHEQDQPQDEVLEDLKICFHDFEVEDEQGGKM